MTDKKNDQTTSTSTERQDRRQHVHKETKDDRENNKPKKQK